MSLKVQTVSKCDEKDCTGLKIVSGRGMKAKTTLYGMGWTSHLQTWRCPACSKQAAKDSLKTWHSRYRLKKYRLRRQKQLRELKELQKKNNATTI